LIYAGAKRRTEKAVAGFVADGVSADGEFIEVQTGSFGPLRRKARELAAHGRVRIIHPVIITKYIEVFASPRNGTRRDTRAASKKTAQCLYRRKSPRRGNPWDLFKALLHAPELPLIPGLRIELALVDVTEQRVTDGKGSWRRKGQSILDRELAARHETILLERPKDYLRFVPCVKTEEFTSTLLAERAGISTVMAGKTLYVLTKLGIVERIGKKGNSWLYRLRRVRRKF
jgi:hypothetical protein